MKEHVAVVGVINQFNKARLFMKQQMGWVKSIACARRNAAPEPFSVDALSPDFVARIRKLTKVAAELVAHASTLLTDAIECEGGITSNMNLLRFSISITLILWP